MKSYIKIFLIVLIIGGVVFVGILDMMTDTISGAAWGFSYIPMTIRSLIYILIGFILVAIVMALGD